MVAPLALAGIGLGLSAGGSLLGGMGRRSEAKRRKAAVGRHGAISQGLANELAQAYLGESGARLDDMSGLVRAFGDVGGAEGGVESMRQGAADRVGNTGQPTQAQPGDIYGQLLATSQQQAAAPIQSAQDATLAQLVMGELQRGMAGEGRTIQANAAGRAPGMANTEMINRIRQLQADLALQEALGDYSSAAATQELIGSLASGLGGMGIMFAGQGGFGGFEG